MGRRDTQKGGWTRGLSLRWTNFLEKNPSCFNRQGRLDHRRVGPLSPGFGTGRPEVQSKKPLDVAGKGESPGRKLPRVGTGLLCPTVGSGLLGPSQACLCPARFPQGARSSAHDFLTSTPPTPPAAQGAGKLDWGPWYPPPTGLSPHHSLSSRPHGPSPSLGCSFSERPLGKPHFHRKESVAVQWPPALPRASSRPLPASCPARAPLSPRVSPPPGARIPKSFLQESTPALCTRTAFSLKCPRPLHWPSSYESTSLARPGSD